MRRRRCTVGVTLLVMVGSILGPGLASAQVDLTKALVGRWEGEIQQLETKTAPPVLVLVISSVREEGGRWIADARSGTSAGLGPVKIEIDNSGKHPSLRWTGGTGIVYNVNLFDEKSLAGTATLTTAIVGRGSRDRSVRYEKKE